MATEIKGSGAPSLGWPVAWAAGLAVPKALGLPIDPDAAFPVGLAISLVANAVAVVALGIAAAGRAARAATGLLAAGLFAVWPLVETLAAGSSVRVNGTWLVETGLHMYSEPLSIALVLVSLALLARRAALDGSTLVWAGIAIGAATTVRVASGLFAVAALLVLLRQDGLRGAVRYAAGGLAVAADRAGLLARQLSVARRRARCSSRSRRSRSRTRRGPGARWRTSHRAALIVLVPLAVLGAVALRGRRRAAAARALGAGRAGLYTFYFVTWTTPRFVLASLSVAFVLVAAGLVAVGGGPAERDQDAPRAY